MLGFTLDSPSVGKQIPWDLLQKWGCASLWADRAFEILLALTGRMGRAVEHTEKEEEDGPCSSLSRGTWERRSCHGSDVFLAQCQLEPGRLQGNKSRIRWEARGENPNCGHRRELHRMEQFGSEGTFRDHHTNPMWLEGTWGDVLRSPGASGGKGRMG